jgi:hypothetical protein
MKQQIEPAYATFEQAKKLKEKGFNELCSVHWEWGNGDKNPIIFQHYLLVDLLMKTEIIENIEIQN